MFSSSSLCNSIISLPDIITEKFFLDRSWRSKSKSSIAFLDRFWKIELFESAHLLKFCAKIRFYEDTGIRCWVVVFERV
jgi:hypothetical protein